MMENGKLQYADIDGYDIFADFDLDQAYIPEVTRLPIKITKVDASAGVFIKNKPQVVFQKNYLEDDKAQFKYNPAVAIFQDTYISAGFSLVKKEARIASQAIEVKINTDYYMKDTIVGVLETEKAKAFRDATYNMFHRTIDGAIFNGSSFENPAINNKGFSSFESESLDPVSVGLPATITGGSADELYNLINSAIDFLKKSGGTTTMERNILLIVGSTIFRQNYGVISGAVANLGMPQFSVVVNAQNYSFTVVASEFLGNDMIICDKNEVEIVLAHSYDIEALRRGYKREPITLLASCGVGSIILYNNQKSLFYKNVLQETPANQKALEAQRKAREKQRLERLSEKKEKEMEKLDELKKALKMQEEQVNKNYIDATE